MCFVVKASISWMLEKSLNCVENENKFLKLENKIGTMRTQLKIGVLCQKRLSDFYIFCKFLGEGAK